MDGTSDSPSSLFVDASYFADDDIWNSSLHENVFAPWHSSLDASNSDSPSPGQNIVPANTEQTFVTIQQLPFNDPPPPTSPHRDFNFFHPSNFLPRALSLVQDPLPSAFNAPTGNITSPQSIPDLDSASPSGSPVSWNVLSSDPESDILHKTIEGPRQERRPASAVHHTDISQRDSNDIVDLTKETDIPPQHKMAPASSPQGHVKRRRVESDTVESSSRRSQRRKTQSQNAVHVAVEEVDLRDMDDDKGLSKVLEDQRMATIRAQQEQASRPVKFATLSCVICMEPMTDVTATYCGHLFCHRCLMEALIAGENQGSEPGKGPSKCPVCRKRIKRPGTSKRETGQVVALEIKIRKKDDKGKGREPRGLTRTQQGPATKRKDPLPSEHWI